RAGPPEDCGGPRAYDAMRIEAPWRVREILDQMMEALSAKDAEAMRDRVEELQSRADSAEGRRPSTGPEKRSAPRAGQRLCGAVASRGRPPARSLRDRNRL